MTRRRALVCGYYAPDPDQDSGSKRLMDQLLALRDEGWAVDYMALNGFRQDRDATVLGARGIAPHDGTATSFEDLVSIGCFDLVTFAFWQTAERYLPTVRRVAPEARVIVDSVDLQLLRDARRTLGDPDHGLLTEEYGSSFVGEVNVYAAADGVLTVSPKEADLINDLTGDPALAAPSPDGERLDRSAISVGRRRGILFVGSFEHAPNADGVQWLCREVLPLLDREMLAQHPVMIVGAGLDDTVRGYAADHPHVQMIGWVPSVTPYIERAAISVVPLLYGAGTKRKLIQSLLVGTPAVTTSIGAEGLTLRHGRHVVIADDAAAFAAGIRELIEQPALWKRLAREGRKAVEDLHARPATQATFMRAIELVLARTAKRNLLPEGSDERYARRMLDLVNQKALPPMRELLRANVRAGKTIAVLNDGSEELLRLGPWQSWHFPQAEDGRYSGRPESVMDALDKLGAIRDRGADYLLVPDTAQHWWDQKGLRDLIDTLSRRYAIVAQAAGNTLFALGQHEPLSERRPGRGDHLRAVEFVPAPRAAADAARLIAFYLPQFHPIPQNDEWWGEGFTEWNNVAAAKPLFPGHYQPHIPADLGFYDLRLAETRRHQAEMARRYGIGGFAYYHYWFRGRRLLERPFQEVLDSGEPDLPFCLCWANEPWTRRWDGLEEDVLMPQQYSRADDVAHLRWLLPALSDERAIRIDDRPVFIVYQARELPNPAGTVEVWRREAQRAGVADPFLMTVETGWDEGWDATEVGFDAKVIFKPQFTTLRGTPALTVDGPQTLQVHGYETSWPALAEPPEVSYPYFETVCPGWDNSARVGDRGVVLHESSPEAYEQWLREVLNRTMRRPEQERIVFINAWNEWAEGAHLEPDLRHGHGYLEATRRALLDSATTPAAHVNGRTAVRGVTGGITDGR